MEQGTKEWYSYRREHIGSSDIAAVLGLSPWKTPYQLWLEKTGRKEESEPNSAMIRGKVLEPKARQVYIDFTGNIIIPNICTSPKWSVAMASLDGISEDGSLIVEIKCPSLNVFNLSLEKVIPPHYLAQIQWQLWVTGAKEAHYFCYLEEGFSNNVIVKPDLHYQEEIVSQAKEFWKLVEGDIPPEILDKDFLMIEDKEANVLARKWIELKEKEEQAKEAKKALEKRLLDLSDDGNCIFPEANVKISRYYRKGAINYSKACKLLDIDLDKIESFRNPPILCTKIEAK